MSNLPEQKTEMMSPSNRFTGLVLKEYQSNSGDLAITDSMQRTLKNYFVKLDSVLKEAEAKRLRMPEQKRSDLEFSWKNVNMEKMAQDCISFAMLGLDPLLPNQLFLIPYKNDRTSKYDIGFMKGYRGLELVVKRFGLDVPKDVVVEVVYSNDEFSVKKKDASNPVESYNFNIPNPFNRGNITGGFYYMKFEDETKNIVFPMSIQAIEKRKPKYASAEFWGGEKDVYSNGKKSGTEKVDGWFDEMVYKTICRTAYNSITIDGNKINDAFVSAMQLEMESETIDTDYSEVAPRAIDFDTKEESTPVEIATGAILEPKKSVVSKDESTKPEAIDFPESN